MAPHLVGAFTELREKGVEIRDMAEVVTAGHSNSYPATYKKTGERLWVKHCHLPTPADIPGEEPYEVQLLHKLSDMDGVPKIICVVYIEDEERWIYAMTTAGEHAVDVYTLIEEDLVDDCDESLPIVLQSIYNVTMELFLRGYMQMDMHPGNFVVDPKTLKVMMVDFGAVHQWRGNPYTDQQFQGCKWTATDTYRPPELCATYGVVPGHHLTWCFGMIAYFVMTGREFLNSLTDYRVIRRQLFTRGTIQQSQQWQVMRKTIARRILSSPIRKLIRHCLIASPFSRIEFDKVGQRLLDV